MCREKVAVHEANHPDAEHWIADLVDPASSDSTPRATCQPPTYWSPASGASRRGPGADPPRPGADRGHQGRRRSMDAPLPMAASHTDLRRGTADDHCQRDDPDCAPGTTRSSPPKPRCPPATCTDTQLWRHASEDSERPRQGPSRWRLRLLTSRSSTRSAKHFRRLEVNRQKQIRDLAV